MNVAENMTINKTYSLYFFLEIVGTVMIIWWKGELAATIVYLLVALPIIILTLICWCNTKEVAGLFLENYETLRQRNPFPLETMCNLSGFARTLRKSFHIARRYRVDIYSKGVIISFFEKALWVPYDCQALAFEGGEYDCILSVKMLFAGPTNKKEPAEAEKLEIEADNFDRKIDEYIQKQTKAQLEGKKIQAYIFDKKADKYMEKFIETKVKADLFSKGKEDNNVIEILIPKEKFVRIKELAAKQKERNNI